MNKNLLKYLWLAFWVFSFLTLLVDLGSWMLEFRSTIRLVLAIFSIALGLSILKIGGRTARSITLVTIGLVVGQWWLIRTIAVLTIWNFVGFAP